MWVFVFHETLEEKSELLDLWRLKTIIMYQKISFLIQKLIAKLSINRLNL